MQVIWSRAAQTRSCRCTSCLHAATTLARRTTTAAGKRRLKASDVFTACYSAMFATAALVDAKVKDDRRKQWDQAIEEARAPSGTASTDNNNSVLGNAAGALDTSLQASPKAKYLSARPAFGAIENILDPNAYTPVVQDGLEWTSSSTSQKTQFGAQLSVLESFVRQALSESSAESNWEDNLPIRPTALDRLSTSAPFIENHLHYMEGMVTKLVLRLLNLVRGSPTESGLLDAVHIRNPISDLNLEVSVIEKRIVALCPSRTQLPAYSTYPRSTYNFYTSQRELNNSIISILTSKVSNQRGVELIVMKICYNLLVSTAPPNAHIYNTMITHFRKLQQEHLANAVVNSFPKDHRFKSSSWTYSLMLDHYAAIGDKDGFEATVQLMRGEINDVTNRYRNIRVKQQHGSSPAGIQSSATDSNVVHRRGYVHWKAPQDEIISRSLISGSLKLFGIEQAIIHFKAALREGVQQAALFIELARACLIERKRHAAVALLSVLLRAWRRNEGVLTLECSHMVRDLIYQLLHFCGIHRSINGEARELVPKELKTQGFDAWLRQIYLEGLEWKLTGSTQTIARLQKVFANSSPRDVVSRMLYHLDLRIQRAGSLVLGETCTALAGSAARLDELERQLIDIIWGTLPEITQEVYRATLDLSQRSMTQSERLKVIVHLRYCVLQQAEESKLEEILLSKPALGIEADKIHVAVRSAEPALLKQRSLAQYAPHHQLRPLSPWSGGVSGSATKPPFPIYG